MNMTLSVSRWLINLLKCFTFLICVNGLLGDIFYTNQIELAVPSEVTFLNTLVVMVEEGLMYLETKTIGSRVTEKAFSFPSVSNIFLLFTAF